MCPFSESMALGLEQEPADVDAYILMHGICAILCCQCKNKELMNKELADVIAMGIWQALQTGLR